MPNVYLRFGYTDEATDEVKWSSSQNWNGIPYPAVVALQGIMVEAVGKMKALGDAAVQLKAKSPTGPAKG